MQKGLFCSFVVFLCFCLFVFVLKKNKKGYFLQFWRFLLFKTLYSSSFFRCLLFQNSICSVSLFLSINLFLENILFWFVQSLFWGGYFPFLMFASVIQRNIPNMPFSNPTCFNFGGSYFSVVLFLCSCFMFLFSAFKLVCFGICSFVLFFLFALRLWKGLISVQF